MINFKQNLKLCFLKYLYVSLVFFSNIFQVFFKISFKLPLNIILSIRLLCCRKRFVDLCEGRVPRGFMTLMKDISLAKTGAQGEYLYNKVQNIVYDDVFSQCMFYPKVSFPTRIILNCQFF